MVTLLLFVMIIIVTELLSKSQVQALISENLTDSQKGFYLEQEAVILAEEVLFLDINPGETLDPATVGMSPEAALRFQRQKTSDSYHDYWSTNPYEKRFGTSWLKSVIVDEDRKINVNYLVNPASSAPVPLYKELIEKILEDMELKSTEISDIVDGLVDYIDKDTKGTHEKNAKNAPLGQIREMLDIEKVTKEFYNGNNFPQGEVSSKDEIEDLDVFAKDEEEAAAEDEDNPDKSPFVKDQDQPKIEDWEELKIVPGFRDIFTVYGDGKINVNTAPFPVLQAIFGEKEAAIAVIIARKKTPFATIEDLRNVAGTVPGLEKYQTLLKTTSDFYRVLMTFKHRHSVTRRHALVRRESTGSSSILFRGAAD